MNTNNTSINADVIILESIKGVNMVESFDLGFLFIIFFSFGSKESAIDGIESVTKSINSICIGSNNVLLNNKPASTIIISAILDDNEYTIFLVIFEYILLPS